MFLRHTPLMRTLMAVAITPDADLAADIPVPLFKADLMVEDD
jgi:hypothetical protein